MAMMINDASLERELIASREATGADRYDEVWEGMYMMATMPNTEHQKIVSRFASIFEELVGWPGIAAVMPGVNLSDRQDDWNQNYRVPDVAVALNDSDVIDCGTHWFGGPDLLVEVVSEGDQTREKIPWYAQLRVKELLIFDRNPWSIELFRWQQNELIKVGQADVDYDRMLTCVSIPINLRLRPGEKRPQIEVVARETDKTWMV